MTDILPPAGWPNVRQLETNEFATGGPNGNMNEQAKSLAARSELLKQKLDANIPTFETPEAGVNPVTGVANGAYFNVRSTDDETVLVEYQNIGGSAVATGKSYLSALGVRQQEKSTSTIKDASGEDQQLLNTGLTTISQLSQITSPYDGMRISVKSTVNPNYALAQPYIGGGEFFYTPTKSSVNDGGVVINGWVRIFDGAVKPEWWGSDSTGAVASDSAIQSAINYCRNNPVRPMGASRGGMGGIELDGIYKLDNGLDLTQVNGISFTAKSKYSAVLLISPTAARMFNLQRYLNVTFEDILFSCGTYNISTDKTITLPEIKNTVAFNLSGQDGGKQLAFNRCRFEGFKTVYRTLDDNINCDTFTATKCDFTSNDTIWENSNVNAVIWAFENCSFYLYKKAFINPANSLRVVGGQAIGDTWWFGDSGSPVLNSYLTFKGIRFESGINLDANAQPKYLDIACATTGVVFEDCPMYGLPSGGIDSVVTGKINFNNPKGDIKFKNMMVYGTFEVISGYAKNGVTNRLTFEDCEKTPTVNQTYTTGAANKYINLIYKDHWLGDTVRVNRNFLSMFNAGGSGGGVAMGQSTVPMIDVFSLFRVATEVGSYSRELPIWCVNPYKLNVSKFEFSYQKGVAASGFTISVYRDSSKSIKIAELLDVGVGRANGVVEIQVSDFLVSQEITASSLPLFVEVTNTASLGLINLDTHVHLIQQAHQF